MKASRLIEMIEAKVESSEEADPQVAIFDGCRIYFSGLPDEWDHVYVGDRFDDPLSESLREKADFTVSGVSAAEALQIHQRRHRG